ncbi:Translation initiation factor 2 [Rhodovulum sp. P5]|uniref:hypothetical protein n=1 Tax=Rhodovulum sp. P5 TaxID=1564506 RepID=UPI0009C23F66|nr:hypothetical protein [Rhodovulum sp. P5]ARE40058.1 Translation initiation factor 2 [Rhodovulum sp. P5]
MKPSFALTLSDDGIGLLHHGKGGWTRLGGASPSDPDLDTTLRALRDKTEPLRDGPLLTKLVIPDSLILYTTLPCTGANRAEKEEGLRRGLDGLTPYALEELAFDWVEAGDTARVAAVACETLEEAEAFARQHAFNPVCFVAAPPEGTFPREPLFGPTSIAADLLPADVVPEREAKAVPPLVKPAGAAGSQPSKRAATPPPEKPVEPKKPAGAAPTPESASAAATPAPVAARRPTAKGAVKRGRRIPVGLVAAAGAVMAIGLGAIMMTGGDETTEPPRETELAALPERPAPTVPAPVADEAPEADTPTAAAELPPAPDAPAPPVSAEIAAETPPPAAKPAEPEEPTAEEPAPVFPATLDIAWQTAPDQPSPPRQDRIEDLYVAALGPSIRPPQSVTLPAPAAVMATDAPLPVQRPPGLQAQPVPPEPVDLVRATPEGVLTPDGITVIAGRPDLLPRPRPFEIAVEPEPAAEPEPPEAVPEPPARANEGSVVVAVISGQPERTPPARPQDAPGADPTAEEQVEITVTTSRPPAVPPPRPAGRADDPAAVEGTAPDPDDEAAAPQAVPLPETAVLVASAEAAARLAGFRPKFRPPGRVPAALSPEADPPATDTADSADDTDVSEQMRTTSLRPAARPSDFAEKAQARTAPATAEARAPKIPTKASVAKQATLRNAINLNAVNLIGVYGSSSDRRALVRLPSGRYLKVKVGDRIDGGRVAAIGDDRVRYVKNGRNIVLDLPGD